MDFADQIAALAARVHKQLEHIQTEEATKNALVLPFINALGYNVFDPTEVVPEFTADVGIKKGEKVDYAIKIDGRPAMLIECKHAGSDLSIKHASQLFRYFHVTEARIGVLTNGLQYRFFSDLEEKNKMDERPFLEFDLLDPKEPLVQELKKLTKAAFNLEALLSAAHELKYTKALKQYLADQWSTPDDDLVRFLTKQVYDGMFTQSVKDQFRDIVRRALHQFVSERISDRLSAALREEQTTEVFDEASQENGQKTAAGPDRDVVTTEEEMEGFRIVRAIVRQVTDVGRIAARDVRSYFGILLDDNNRKPICRLYFNTSQKYIEIFDVDGGEKIPIDGLDDIYSYAERLQEAVKRFDGES